MKFRMLKSRKLMDSRLYVVNEETWAAPDGKPFIRHTLVHPGAVAVLARDAEERFLLLSQFRAACRGMLLEIPAGTLEKGESPLACAKRELIEETGFRARRWKRLGKLYLAPGYTTEQLVIYEAWDLKPAFAEKDEDEHFHLVKMSAAELQKAMTSGRLKDAKTLCALLLAGVEGDRWAKIEAPKGATLDPIPDID